MYKVPDSLAKIRLLDSKSSDQAEESARLNRIESEFQSAFDFLEELPKNVSIFGASTSQPGDLYYEKARNLASRLVSEHGLAIVTGGGPGIMEAANRGAVEAGGVSVGLHIDITTGESRNPYPNRTLDFHYFFARKLALTFAASMYIFFPGGYGTMDEFFEIITLIQTNKIQSLPIVCFGAGYWEPLLRFMDYYMLRSDGYINNQDLKLFKITDSSDLILDMASHLPDRK